MSASRGSAAGPARSGTLHRAPLAIVQAGGRGSRMDVLTRERAKPALPFAATHRLIDFPLSALSASGISDVWVSDQYQASSMDDYLAGGRPWDLDRNRGGFRRMSPEEGTGSPLSEGFSQGNADDLYRLSDRIADVDPSVLVVMSADSIFSEDVASLVAEHVESGAACTLVTAEVGLQEARQKMVVSVAGGGTQGAVAGVAYKPAAPTSGTVATEIFLYDPQVLRSTLEALVQRHGEGADTGLGDFGERLIPELVRQREVRATPVQGYWKDVGRPQAYLQACRDLLAGRIDVFSHPARPVLAHFVVGPPGLIAEGASVEQSMVGPGSRVHGRVVRSILGPDVHVEAGAIVEDSVLFGDSRVESGARVSNSIVDTGCWVGRDARVGQHAPGTRLSDESICLVGQDSRIGRSTVVPAGSRLEPGTTT